MSLFKYKGIIPALYACYDEEGEVDSVRIQKLVRYYMTQGVRGLYVNGSSGECIYQNVADRKKILEAVMEVASGSLTIINHVACNNTRDSVELAKHSEKLGVDAIAAIPPIYFKLSEEAIADYWNTISKAAPNTDFILYNIPQLAGVALTEKLYKKMLDNPCVIGVKNSSLSVQDIQLFSQIGGDERIVFNGPDEQYIAGRVMGAEAGIGGTYGVMPALFVKLEEFIQNNQLIKARDLQKKLNQVIALLTSGRSHLYALAKEVLSRKEGLALGSVRAPLPAFQKEDEKLVTQIIALLLEIEATLL
ncbi:dihydrodipicolinate synthase family protein [Streptococcus sp. NLN64]|uniref:dihydrodipicolinate synthase family protein n=1 Tax=Streptococcus sp. NLN64 TaxID=2822799 RepID=UPI0018CA9F66|nr:dihydrodipicolinate synthase family protein [Streptococcus sp. NLN64]MBG9367843.1 dihydrodipicolinate synthase family protein [Streptococcus sp. NLN64]